MRVKFITSAADASGWPKPDRPEVALAGRSNAGKSSFLNALAGGSVAKVSQQPGKTRLLNFFDVGENYRVVDMPGYGFSKRSGDEQSEWGPLIEEFVETRESLLGVVLLMDVRRDWGPDEQQILDYVQAHGRRIQIVLTKSDTLNRKDLKNRMDLIAKQSRELEIFVVSNRDMKSVQEVEAHIFKNWVKGQ